MNVPRLLLKLLLGKRLPRLRGKIAVPGLLGRLRVHRDRWGIPHIEAEKEMDAHFGLGFCHGQDRTFQLELLQRILRGTLAELLGPGAVAVDRLSRRVGFHRAAEEQWPVLDAELREMLQAYARGVTAGATNGLRRRPHEFVMVGARPTPWTPIDSLALIKLMSFNLPSNWDIELARLKVIQEDGSAALAALDPAYDPDHPVTMPVGGNAGPLIDYLAHDFAAFSGSVPARGASNNWCLAATRTRTGRPLLANDPHMTASLPTHWYLAHLQTPSWAAAGASFVGGPGVFSGHNGHCAWGITAGLVDNTDLFREIVGPDEASVKEGDGWTPCTVREEVIRVKGAQDVTERVLITPRGPIITPGLSTQQEALSIRATWLDPGPIQGLFFAQHARNWDQFRQYTAHWPALSQNVVYADQSGVIAWQLMGTAPRRKRGFGTFPLPGWEPDVGWHADAVPFAQMPHAVDPPQGFIATANTRPLPYGAGPFLGVDWIDGFRLRRVNQLLESRADWDVTETMAMQCDPRTLAWEQVKPIVLTLPRDNPHTAQALALLQSWDGRLTADSPAGTVYELFLAELASRLAKAKAPNTYCWVLGESVSVLTAYNFWAFRRTNHLARLLHAQPAGWFARSWSAELTDILAALVRRLQTEHGPEPQAWAWGKLRPLVMVHPMGRRGGWLSRAFNLGPVPCGGDTDTINQASAMPLRPLSPAENIAALRVVIDVGNWGASRFVVPGGQSGNPLSPNYDDLFSLWQRGEGVPIAWTPEEVRQATVHTLELTPN